MIIRNFRNSGSAVGAVNYVLSDRDANRALRSVRPKILRGNPELTKTIDREFCQNFRHKSLSGVLSFREGEGDHFTEQQKQELIDDFEKAMFGNMRSRVNALYVEHRDKEGNRLEIHYVLNRVDMLSGNFYNPNPPGKLTKELVKTFTALKNQEYGFEVVVEDPLRTKYTDDEIKGRSNPRNGFKKLKGKIQIDQALQDLVKDGTLKNRASLIKFLIGSGLSLSRTSTDSISIENKDGRNIRLRGGIYADTGKDYHTIVKEKSLTGMPDYAQNLHRLNTLVDIRNQGNEKRFKAKARVTPALSDKSHASIVSIPHKRGDTAPQAPEIDSRMPTVRSKGNALRQPDMASNDDAIHIGHAATSTHGADSIQMAMASVSLAYASLANASAQLNGAKTPQQRAQALAAFNAAQASFNQAQAQLVAAKIRELLRPTIPATANKKTTI